MCVSDAVMGAWVHTMMGARLTMMWMCTNRSPLFVGLQDALQLGGSERMGAYNGRPRHRSVIMI